MDIINALALLAPCILGVVVRRIIRRIEEARQNTCDSVRVEPTRQWRKSRAPTRIVAEKPIKPRGKFPEWAKQLSERELFELVYASLRDRPIEETVKIGSGGETIWLSGYRKDKEFGYSEQGRDLVAVTVYYN